MELSEKSVKISGEIVMRCPKCKAVAAWEIFDGKNRTRSWVQQYRYGLIKQFPYIGKLPIPHEPKCPQGCNLEN